jgi:hypothetical protein
MKAISSATWTAPKFRMKRITPKMETTNREMRMTRRMNTNIQTRRTGPVTKYDQRQIERVPNQIQEPVEDGKG